MSFVGTDKTLNRARKLKWRACSSRFDDSIKTGQALRVARGRRLRLGFAGGVNGGEVDRLEKKWREAALGREIGNQAPREGKQIAGTLHHQHGFKVGLGNAGDLEETGID